MTDRFDPFTDRRSRDIRNALSQALMRTLDGESSRLFEQVTSDLLEQNPELEYRAYLRERLWRYRQAYSEITLRGLAARLSQAQVLWNRGLFFEAHERLEKLWRESSAEYRVAVKGLIKAAGVFLHMELGRESSARRLASKAHALLEQHGHLLPLDVTQLLKALEEDRPQPPRL